MPVQALVLRDKRLMIAQLILPPERVRVPAVVPEFGFLQMNGGNPAVHGGLQALRQVICKGHRGHHIRHAGIMENVFPLPVPLRFIPVVPSIPFPIQVLLIAAPCDPCHQMHHIACVRELPDALRHGFIGSVDHDKVAHQVNGRFQRPPFLIPGQLFRFLSDVCHTASPVLFFDASIIPVFPSDDHCFSVSGAIFRPQKSTPHTNAKCCLFRRCRHTFIPEAARNPGPQAVRSPRTDQ